MIPIIQTTPTPVGPGVVATITPQEQTFDFAAILSKVVVPLQPNILAGVSEGEDLETPKLEDQEILEMPQEDVEALPDQGALPLVEVELAQENVILPLPPSNPQQNEDAPISLGVALPTQEVLLNPTGKIQPTAQFMLTPQNGYVAGQTQPIAMYPDPFVTRDIVSHQTEKDGQVRLTPPDPTPQGMRRASKSAEPSLLNGSVESHTPLPAKSVTTVPAQMTFTPTLIAEMDTEIKGKARADIPEAIHPMLPSSDRPPQLVSTPKAHIAQADQARMIAAQLTAAVSKGADGTTEIRLNPDELGRVRLTMSSSENGMAVTIVADRPETHDLMRRNLDQLAAEFRQLGYGDTTFTFSQGNKGEGDTDADASTRHLNDTTEIDTETTTVMLVTDGLDLRL